MKKIVRILGLIQLIRQKKNYSSSVRWQLIGTLLFLEYKSYISKESAKPVLVNILHYKVHAFGFTNLCLLFREIFIHEEYQFFTTNENAPVIVDCGANIGMATLYLKWKFPNALIHSFEPDPSAFALLEKNISQNNLQNIVLHNEAAMPQEGELDFFISEQTKASLMMSTVQGRMDEQKITVKGIDFAAFINQLKPSLLKIDIEGAEKKVFAKMDEESSLNHLNQIMMEYHHKIDHAKSDFSEMLTVLEKNGFEYNLITSFETAGQFQDVLIYAYRK
jgi:FkbM family methyltransferase